MNFFLHTLSILPQIITKKTNKIRIGGPLIRDADQKLIGITSFARISKHKNSNILIDLQVFTDLHHHFVWIAEKTGMSLPKCHGSHFLQSFKEKITKWYGAIKPIF